MNSKFKFSLAALATLGSMAVAGDSYEIFYDGSAFYYKKGTDIVTVPNQKTFEPTNYNENIINIDFDTTAPELQTVKGGHEKNKITLKSGKVTYLYGGHNVIGENYSISGNEVYIEAIGASGVSGGIYGGYTEADSGVIEDNHVYIKSGRIDGDVYGGYSYNYDVTATKNSVEITGGQLYGDVYGGYTREKRANAENNSVQLKGGINYNKSVYGGYSVKGLATNNSVVLDGGVVTDGNIYGGYSEQSDATNNSVTIVGGSGGTNIYGGASGYYFANTTNNTVTIKVNSNYAANYIYGGYVGQPTTDERVRKGNTLNLGSNDYRVESILVKNIFNFENLDFYLPTKLGNDYFAMKFTDKDTTDLTNTTIKVNGSDDGYKAYLDGTDNKYYLLKSDGKIIVDDTWLKSTQSVVGNTFNVISKTEYNIPVGGIFQSSEKNDLYITSAGGKLTETITGDTFGDDEAGMVDGMTVNLTTDGANYDGLKINLSKQATINLSNATNVGDIEAGSSDVSIADSTLNGSTSVKSLNLSGTISAANDILAVNDITINKADLNLQGGLKSSNSNIAFNDSKGSIKGDIEANKVSFVSGSNLNTITANDIKAKEIEFNLPNSANYNNVALQLTTTGNTDLSSTKVSAFLSDASNLNGNGVIHLIQTAGTLKAPSTTDVSGVDLNVAGLINVKANIELDSTNQNLDLTFNGTPSGSGGGGSGGATANEGAKTLLETKLSQNTVVNEGANLFVSNLGDIANSANNANSALSANGANSTNSNLDLGKAVTFAFVSGYDKEMTTGSHIDIKGFNANAGIAGNDYFSSGNLTTGLFVEYGKGEYDSFLDDGTKGSGKTEFIGGGAFARFTTLNNFYTEVSGRVGQVKTEYETTAEYKGFDISNTYYGAHLGLGKIFELTSSNDLDIFARGIWAKTAGNDIVLNGIQTHFDSVTSLRAQVGLKDNIKFSDTSKLYVGASYQYEFDGEAKGTLIVPAINAVADIASPKLKGSTGIGEIGYVYENSSIKFEAGAKGYVGKEKGYSGNLGVTFKF